MQHKCWWGSLKRHNKITTKKESFIKYHTTNSSSWGSWSQQIHFKGTFCFPLKQQQSNKYVLVLEKAAGRFLKMLCMINAHKNHFSLTAKKPGLGRLSCWRKLRYAGTAKLASTFFRHSSYLCMLAKPQREESLGITYFVCLCHN